MKSDKQWSLGIDIGGTKTYLGVIDQDGKLERSELIKTKTEGPAAVIEDIVLTLQRLNIHKENLLVAGVGIAGQVEKDTGTLYYAPNLNWHHVPLASQLGKALGIPVKVTNDVRAATWGEWLYGAGCGCSDLVCLFIGTGIGAGIISGGRILTGTSNSAGEVGHMTIDLHGPLCSCGNHGCFEAIAGGRGIERRIKEVLLADPAGARGLLDMVNGKMEDITARHVFDAWRSNVPAAMLVVEEVKEGLIAGAASLVNIFNPSKIILGGGIIQGNLELVDIIRHGIPKRALKSPVEHVSIAVGNLQGKAGVIGAAAFAREMVYRKD